MNTFYLAWQDPEKRRWFPVGRLERHGSAPKAMATGDGAPRSSSSDTQFVFTYTEGALEAQREGRFSALKAFPELHAEYTSPELFPLFANRMLSESRPEYERFVEWTTVQQSENDPLALLARSGGERATDTLEVFPQPEKDARGNYCVHFFAHGVRHENTAAVKHAARLEPGDPLLMMGDFQNSKDPRALALRTAPQGSQDKRLMGYLPRYLLDDVHRLLDEDKDERGACVQVERVNRPPAPVHFRILCRLEMRWPSNFQPFDTPSYKPLKAKRTAHV